MDQDTQKYYETYFELFASDGWKQFIEETQEIHDGYQIEHIKDDKDLSRIKGERAMLFRVSRFESAIKSHYDLIMEKSGDS